MVEDDAHVAGALTAVLTSHGFSTVHAADGRSALGMLDERTDMVLLDLGLPDMDGLEVCSRIRGKSTAPIIVVTARSRLHDRVRGLRVGADDYLVKPYDVRELIARIEAVARRSRPPAAGAAQSAIVVGDLRVDLATRHVLVGGRQVELTKMEFDLLAMLARHPGVVLPRDRILQEVWSTTWKGLGRSLEVHVASLRRKLGDRELIQTVRGVGYRLLT